MIRLKVLTALGDSDDEGIGGGSEIGLVRPR
jgi:hypothetical protein